jgi:AcrR family transcriptional regulator
MPRKPDPELEGRFLHAADVLWRRGGEHALTMRAVAKAARTNTPAVYRRFKNREDLIRGLLRGIVARLRVYFEQGQNLEAMAEAYVEFALKMPHEYELFYSYGTLLNRRTRSKTRLPIRESRPNFRLAEQMAARELGGTPDDHTELALQLWSLLHGMTMLLLTKSLPDGHEGELRDACRTAVKTLIANAKQKR